ncbi:hypothetical protein V8G54_001674 [Vigna mungo]|uniref:Uncharacterized protein n=1 Tax=Vigna mungo TaxID=3915 RepID=A0AAQ3P7G5_VIGMU
MTRKRIQIKKIDNISSRQVTFSKRRKGLFKKAQELSTLCDADIALIVFSATSKLFDYASSSMQQVIERRDRHSAMHRLDRPSMELQGFDLGMLPHAILRTSDDDDDTIMGNVFDYDVKDNNTVVNVASLTSLMSSNRGFIPIVTWKHLCRFQIYAQIESDSNDILRKKVEDKNRELRQLNGEDLQGLTLQELQKIEENLKRGLTNVSKVKDDKVMQEIRNLKRKGHRAPQGIRPSWPPSPSRDLSLMATESLKGSGMELMEENQRLKQVPSLIQLHRQSSESIISNSSNLPEDGYSDTSLKLGLP